MDLSVVSYNHVTKSENDNDKEAVLEPMLSSPKTAVKTVVKYRECMRNHAASMGGHANDGCGEFMPRGGGDSRESLTCAACGCHRNFHMREVIGRHFSAPTPMLLYNACTAAARPHHRYDGGDRRSETPERVEPSGTVIRAGTTSTTAAKRFRTRFTQEQKDKMLEFAERIGWRIQRQDDVALNQFCSELGIKRNVLKVWMHNNKNAHRRRDSAQQSPPSPPPPSQPVGV